MADWQDAGVAGLDVAMVDVGADAAQALDAVGFCGGPAFVLLADDQSNHASLWLEEGFTVLPRDATLDMIAGAAHAAAAGLVAPSHQLWTATLRFTRLGVRDDTSDFEPLT